MNARRWNLIGGHLGGWLPQGPFLLKKILKGVISKTAKFFSLLTSFGASSLLPPLLSAARFLRVQEQKRQEHDVAFSQRPCPVVLDISCVPCTGHYCFLEAPVLLTLDPASASQLCVGGCYLVSEAVGILNSPVIISEEMHIMVVWQPQNEVMQFQISAKESHLSARALSPLALPAAVAWGRRSPVGRALNDLSLW